MTDLSDLNVALRIDGRPSISAPVLDVTPTEVAVDFRHPDPPALAVSQGVELVFSGRSIGSPATIRATVTYRSDEAETRSYRFQLNRAEGTALFAAVNRRAAFRVAPDPEHPIPVTLRPAGQGIQIQGTLSDISQTGFSILVDPEDERRLIGGDPHLLAFRLPGSERRLALLGSVRYRRLTGEGVLYGIHFDAHRSPDFARQQRVVMRYVAARQAEVLRKVRS